MTMEVITQRDDLVIRRLILQPGEALGWHVDPFHRFSVVIRGERLRIDYRDGDVEEFDVTPGEAGWNAPEARVHRAVNVGSTTFEEVVTFYIDKAGADPQPETVSLAD
jgi:quercetin dioxygenase-like cupin family protein